MFFRWSDDLSADVELCCIQLPGRESRMREPLIDRLEDVVERLSYYLLPLLDVPFAFFGHSMGSLISFETARYLRRNHDRNLMHLFVSAHQACHLRTRFPPIHGLADADLVREIALRYRGIPAVILRDAEFLGAWLPVFRADLTILESYVYQEDDPLACPLSAFGGSLDPVVAQEELAAWREQTCNTFRLRTLAGDHFYFRTARGALVRAIQEDLAESRSAGMLRAVNQEAAD